jgi:protoporphyrinogen oxidase
MEEIPRQMASRLSAGALVTGARVKSLKRAGGIFILEVEGMAPLEARTVVLATAEHEARRLLGPAVKSKKLGAPRQWNSTTTIYYAADQAPVDEPILMLNGEGPEAGPVNHAALMTAVSRGYAPKGEHLIAVNVVGEAPESDAGMAGLEQRVRTHLGEWFGAQVKRWRVLGGYPIRYALALQRVAEWEKSDMATRVGAAADPGARVFLCGDYRETASLQGALASGRRVANALISEMKV